MKKIKIYILTFIMACSILSSCQDYLDIVPEGVPSIDNAFSNRISAKKFLHTCYSYLPSVENPESSIAFLGGDEFWLIPEGQGVTRLGFNCWRVGQGLQNSNDPYLNFWDGGHSGNNLWIAIHDCNIFLKEIHRPQDLEDYERDRWIGEVTFLKAYYHFYLLQLYGPIPITDENIAVNAGVDKVRVFRDPVDDVVDYIVETMDKASTLLNNKVDSETLELGRITRAIVLAQKAKVLALAASPLFNGNPDYAYVIDSKGRNLFSTEYDNNKWTLAAEAAKKAIEAADSADHRLYEFSDISNVSDVTRTKMSIRNAVCDSWNEEIIWGSSRNSNFLQDLAMAKLVDKAHFDVHSLLAPTLQVAEQFYSSNGVPLKEDKEFWAENYETRYDVIEITDEGDNKYYMDVDKADPKQTAKLHFNREPRFYATLGFDTGTWYSSGDANDTTGTTHLRSRAGHAAGLLSSEDYSITGYHAKKLCQFKSTITEHAWRPERYAYPIIRLADIYLIYAEALNESLERPNEEVYKYIDVIRSRAGLDGVVESWKNYSLYPNKVENKDGMREIIRNERLNELALEGHRFFDLRRWKVELPSVLKGWNVTEKEVEDYYKIITIDEKAPYSYRDYLWPIKIGSLQRNPNLVQNPGW